MVILHRLFFRFRLIILLALAFVPGLVAGGTVWAKAGKTPSRTAYHFVGHLSLTSMCFDTMAFADHNLYLADATNRQVDVFNLVSLASESAIGTQDFTGQAGCLGFDFSQMGPSGLLIDPRQRLWASNGDSTINVFSLQGHLLAHISTGGQDRVDALALDPLQHAVLAVNSDDTQPFLSLIDVYHNFDILDRFPVPGADEAIWDTTHQRFLVSEPGAVVAFQIRHDQLQQTARWQLLSCQASGLALGEGEQVMVGCSNGGAMLLNTSNGAIEAQIASPAIDLVSYSEKSKQYALATFTGPTTPGAVLLVDQTGSVRQQIPSAPLSHAVFQTQTWLIIPERGSGLQLYQW